jgi:hypothetical protein
VTGSAARDAERRGPPEPARAGASRGDARDAMIDAHHHLWDLRAVRYPWLVDAPVQGHFGPYEAIRRDYRIGTS